MKIGLVVTPIIQCPPERYGGIERVAYWLGQDLVKLGHKVTLFARDGSYLDGAEVITFPGSEGKEYAQLIANKHRGTYFDVIHDFTHDKHLTGHFRYESRVINTLQGLAKRGPNTACISYAQRKHLYGELATYPVVYNRVPTDYFVPINNPTRDYLLYMGSINDYKGVDIAVEVAIETGNILKICGPAWDPAYFDKFVKPKIGDNIQFIGDVGGEEKLSLLQNAKALFHPVRWCEAGAIIVSESISCGTPVVGSYNGVLPELISPAVGKLASVLPFDEYTHGSGGRYDKKEMIWAVETIDEVDRDVCRGYAEAYFDKNKSTEEYVQLYNKITSGETW